MDKGVQFQLLLPVKVLWCPKSGRLAALAEEVLDSVKIDIPVASLKRKNIETLNLNVKYLEHFKS